MEVDKITFWGRLLPILTAISDAHFVSIDLELSGVASKNPSGGARRATLQERYVETKAAAERYTILQIGMTCAFQDLVDEKYVLRPYNFNLNPSFEEKLDLERIFSFQSGAVDFLLAHGFQMSLPFTHGVPYLSRDEAKRAKLLAEERLDRTHTEDIQLKETDVQSLAFVARVRKEMNLWIKTRRPHPDHLYVRGRVSPGESTLAEATELSRFEKRLVHQLVRAEFKDYKTLSQQDGIKIILTDPMREQQIRIKRKKVFKEQIARQTGFRWVIEALAGGDLDGLDVLHMSVDPVTGDPRHIDLADVRSRLGRAQDALKRHPPVLVGHNMFTDLVYLYKTFIGSLPETVQEFTQEISKVFPNIADTKWLATEGDSDIPSKSSLEETEEKLRHVLTPKIEVDSDHPNYMTEEPLHEAGYDAYLTARVMILLSAKLEAAGTYASIQSTGQPSDADDYETAPEETGGVSLKTVTTLNPIKESERFHEPEQWGMGSDLTVTASPEGNKGIAVLAKKRKKKGKKKHGISATSSSSTFASTNLYATLEQLPLDDSNSKTTVSPSEHLPDSSKLANSSPVASSPSSPSSQPASLEPRNPGKQQSTISYVKNGTTFYVKAAQGPSQPQRLPSKSIFGNPSLIGSLMAGNPAPRQRDQSLTFMPPYHSDFWRVYGNKLRVYGTEEQVLVLGEDDM